MKLPVVALANCGPIPIALLVVASYLGAAAAFAQNYYASAIANCYENGQCEDVVEQFELFEPNCSCEYRGVTVSTTGRFQQSVPGADIVVQGTYNVGFSGSTAEGYHAPRGQLRIWQPLTISSPQIITVRSNITDMFIRLPGHGFRAWHASMSLRIYNLNLGLVFEHRKYQTSAVGSGGVLEGELVQMLEPGEYVYSLEVECSGNTNVVGAAISGVVAGTYSIVGQGSTGACCLPDGACEVLSASQCAERGGRYWGEGSTCGEANCRGACCLPDGNCAQLPQEQCTDRAGTYQGDGTDCASYDCPEATLRWIRSAGGEWASDESWSPGIIPSADLHVLFDLPPNGSQRFVALPENAVARSGRIKQGDWHFAGGRLELREQLAPALLIGTIPQAAALRLSGCTVLANHTDLHAGTVPGADATLTVGPGAQLLFNGVSGSAVRLGLASGAQARLGIEESGLCRAGLLQLDYGAILAREDGSPIRTLLLGAIEPDAETELTVARELTLKREAQLRCRTLRAAESGDLVFPAKIALQGSGSTLAAHRLEFATEGDVTLEIAAGAVLHTHRALLATRPDARAVVALSGPGTTWIDEVGSERETGLKREEQVVELGAGGAVELRIEGGALADFVGTGVTTAVAPESTVDIALRDDGSVLRAGVLQIGQRGQASLSASGGARVEAGLLSLGLELGASGTLVVAGAGSGMGMTQTNLEVGRDGAGVLRVEGGGNVWSAGTGGLGIAYLGAGQGTVVATGSDSQLLFWDLPLVMGSPTGGKAVIEIRDGGAAHFGFSQIGKDSALPEEGGVAARILVSDGELEFNSTAQVLQARNRNPDHDRILDILHGIGFWIGNEGELIVENGGRVSCKSMLLGSKDFGRAEVRLAHEDSALAAESIYTLYDYTSLIDVREGARIQTALLDVCGYGRLRVSSGAQVIAAEGRVGVPFLQEEITRLSALPLDYSTNAAALVEGQGSLWRCGDLLIGSARTQSLLGLLQIDNAGTVECDTLRVERSGRVVGNGGNLVVSNSIVNGGTVAPGLSPGVLTLHGDYTQTDAGALEIEIGGLSEGEYDVLRVIGNANLAGKLEIRFVGGFVPPPDLSLEFLQVEGNVEGQFDEVVLLMEDEAGGLAAREGLHGFDAVIRDGGLRLVGPNAPETLNGLGPCPATATMMVALTFIGFLWVRRRKAFI